MKVVALSGGVGGARLVAGLAACLQPDELTVIVNTGDDFEHCGLWICPDLDTVMYTLSGRAPLERGWGLAEEDYRAMDGLKALGGPDWFALSDQDLSTHLRRTHRQRQGADLSTITKELMRAHGIECTVYPMTDAPHPTRLQSGSTLYEFQEWFVGQRAQPPVDRIIFPSGGRASEEVIEALNAADLIVLTPSNPYLSIDPMLSLSNLSDAWDQRQCLCVAVSPIVGRQAVKGPLAQLIEQLANQPASADAVANHYGDRVDGWVVQEGDTLSTSIPVLQTQTMMTSPERRKNLARAILDWAQTLRSRA
jgi:LPPG:FO 2-phospho-L-lactate transferase